MKYKWELLSSEDGPNCCKTVTSRLRVPTGWLVRVVIEKAPFENASSSTISTTFIPDELHLWDSSIPQ